MENDIIVTCGKSVIQHGYFNNRIYLMKIHPDDAEVLVKRIGFLQHLYHYSKIVMKVPQSLESLFKSVDTIKEASIPGFYQGREDAVFLSRFLDAVRSYDESLDVIQQTIKQSLKKESPISPDNQSKDVIIRKATIEDVPLICALYRSAFVTYPFPIQEPYYLKQVMNDGIVFYVGETQQRIVCAGSCETDLIASAVEMSDLAVEDAFKGLRLSRKILSFMEQDMVKEGIKTAYTICRAIPIPVNRLFVGAGYEFGGTLIKNTNICGNFESMNVWYKRLC